MRKRIFALLLTTIAATAFGSDIVKLEAYPTPPWQVDEDGMLSGPPVDVLDCVFSKLDRHFELVAVPWRRAELNTRSGQTDGFFSGANIPSNDENPPSWSAPIGLEKWYWVSAKTADLFTNEFPGDFRVGAVNGSSQMVWLSQQGFKFIEPVSEQAQLPALLDIQRIDLYIASLEALTDKDATVSSRRPVALRFARYAPLRAVFSREFLNRNTGFLKQFNSHLAGCQTGIAVLAENERHKLRLLLDTMVSPWLDSPEIRVALTLSNQEHSTLDQATILTLDKTWRQEVRDEDYQFTQQILDSTLSRYLQVLRDRQDGLVTEIIVMDSKGVNVGISDLTTDYWQGDEEKFQRAAALPSGVYLSDIKFDRSTQTFQVQASFPVRDEDSLAGVVTVGVDIEKALLKD